MNVSLRYTIALVLLVIGVTTAALRVRSNEAPPERHYVGQESCMSAGCHAGAYGDTSDYQGATLFRETMHQKIHLRPSPETVVIDKYFEGDSVLRAYDPDVDIAGKDTLLIFLSKSADRKDYFIQMKFSGGGDSTEKMKVAYTYGGNGWIQRYLVEINGYYYTPPFQYLLPGYRDRSDNSNTFYFLDREKWYYNDSTTAGEAKFLKWTSKKFTSLSWNRNCAFCHVNGFGMARTIKGTDTNYTGSWVGVAERDSALQDQNIRIGCESCHGPGSEHVVNPYIEGSIINPNKWPMTFQATDLKLDLCNQCHDRIVSTKGVFKFPYDDANQIPYRVGTDMNLYTQGVFRGMNLWVDGKTSYAHHQTGQDYARSKEYAGHVFKNGCWDCHTVHQNKPGLPYQLDRDWYTLQEGQGCLECHGGMAATSMRGDRVVNTHTQHSVESSQCVNCHFTKTASIGFVDMPKKRLYEFSSHGFKVLRPTLTTQYASVGLIGMMNTCAESCHRNGRGSRNSNDSMPLAPDFGITDAQYGRWSERTDLWLADSLWYHYRLMYAQYVSAVRETGAVTGETRISAVTPNPMTTTATIRFMLAKRGDISLAVYDLRGTLVRTLAAGLHESGSYVQTWDGTDELNGPVESGTYLIRLKAGRAVSSQKIVLNR